MKMNMWVKVPDPLTEEVQKLPKEIKEACIAFLETPCDTKDDISNKITILSYACGLLQHQQLRICDISTFLDFCHASPVCYAYFAEKVECLHKILNVLETESVKTSFVIFPIKELPGLANLTINALDRKGITQVNHIRQLTRKELEDIRYIGRDTAKNIINMAADAYAGYGIDIGTRIEDLPGINRRIWVALNQCSHHITYVHDLKKMSMNDLKVVIKWLPENSLELILEGLYRYNETKDITDRVYFH